MIFWIGQNDCDHEQKIPHITNCPSNLPARRTSLTVSTMAEVATSQVNAIVRGAEKRRPSVSAMSKCEAEAEHHGTDDGAH